MILANFAQLGIGRFQCSTRKENKELGYTYTGWGIDFRDLLVSGKGMMRTVLVGQFGVKHGAKDVSLRDLTITSPKRDGLVVSGSANVQSKIVRSRAAEGMASACTCEGSRVVLRWQ